MITNLLTRVAQIGAIAFASILLTSSAQATTIDFEDATTLTGYQGFNWSGEYGDSSWVLATAGGTFSPNSGSKFVWSNGGAELSLSGAVFDFNSFWAYGQYGSFFEGIGLTVKGYLGGNLVYTSTVGLGSSYQQFSFNFLGVDTVVFPDTAAGEYYNLVIDDITVNGTSSVPDGAATIALLAMSFTGLIAARRNFLKA